MLTGSKLMGALATALLLAACTETPTRPDLQDIGPPPSDARGIVLANMEMNLKDPYSVQGFVITPPRPGGVWTGLVGQGLVPAWYSCVMYNAKNSFGAYTGMKPFVYFIRHDRVVAVSDPSQTLDYHHKHDCWGKKEWWQ